jgi:hypothetical protein
VADRAHQISYRGVATSRHLAAKKLSKPGDAVVVERGRPRMLLMRCPCGCGDDLLVNLDRRVGPAWRHYSTRRGLTLYPSYWREGNCGSHFIIWNDRIYWCYGWEVDESDDWSVPATIEEAVLAALPTDRFIKYPELADKLSLIPWEVLQACRQLVERGAAIAGKRFRSPKFRRVA